MELRRATAHHGGSTAERMIVLPGLERGAGGDLKRQAERSEAALWIMGRGTNMIPRLLLGFVR